MGYVYFLSLFYDVLEWWEVLLLLMLIIFQYLKELVDTFEIQLQKLVLEQK